MENKLLRGRRAGRCKSAGNGGALDPDAAYGSCGTGPLWAMGRHSLRVESYLPTKDVAAISTFL